MGLAWLLAAAVAAVLASWAFNALVYLVWRPRAITEKHRAQGVHGPGYRFFAGNLGDIKRLRAEAAGSALNVGDHDFVPLVQPHLRKWIPLYGAFFSACRVLLFILTPSFDQTLYVQAGRSCTGPVLDRTCAWPT
jgi:cytochrome P450 family 709